MHAHCTGWNYLAQMHGCTSSVAFPAPPLPRPFPLTHSLFLTTLLPHPPLATLNLHYSCTFCPSPSHTFSPPHTLTHPQLQEYPRSSSHPLTLTTAVTIFHMMHRIPKDENFSAQLSNLEDKTFITASLDLSESRPLATLVPIYSLTHSMIYHDCTSPASFPGSSSASVIITQRYKETGDRPGNERIHYTVHS